MKIVSILAPLLLVSSVRDSLAEDLCPRCAEEEIKNGECDFDLCDFGRRLVSTAAVWSSVNEKCDEAIYDLFLYVNTHVYLVASPKQPSIPQKVSAPTLLWMHNSAWEGQKQARC